MLPRVRILLIPFLLLLLCSCGGLPDLSRFVPSAPAATPGEAAAPQEGPAPPVRDAVNFDPADASAVAAARTTLDRLPVRSDLGRDGYSRAEFDNEDWADSDQNGCDQRTDTLWRDMSDIRTRSGDPDDCSYTYGRLDDPYAGTVYIGTTRLVQIDHVVPLELAWQSGAADWEGDAGFARRAELAVDPDNLQSTRGTLNGQKSNSGPEEWAPPNRCYWATYAVRYVTVADRYGLSVTSDRRAALAEMLAVPAELPCAA